MNTLQRCIFFCIVCTLSLNTDAVLFKKQLQRREALVSDVYGAPPRVPIYAGNPAPVYGPPHLPHREYGVPQQVPFREYGVPSPQYGPPKINLAVGNGGSGGQNIIGSLHEQVKNYFGIQKPFYGPPHRPATSYGPPQIIIAQSKPFQQYGPPKPASSYGPPQAVYGSPQQLPQIHPASLFTPAVQRPINSYDPPPSGQFAFGHKTGHYLSSKPIEQYYGPPPLPQLKHHIPETTIILSGTGVHNHHQGPVKQVHAQISSVGQNAHVAPFHTACDGWKPIPGPTGHYIEHNHIDTQSGYSQISSGAGTTNNGLTAYNSAAGSSGSFANAGGLSDAQLVAVALQSGNIGSDTKVQFPVQSLPESGPAVDFHRNVQQSSNSIEDEIHKEKFYLTGNDDSYLKPPSDSYAPISARLVPPNQNAQKFATLGIEYGTESGNLRPWLNNGPIARPQSPVAYRPPVPQGLLESIGATVQHLDQFGVKPNSQPSKYIPPPSNEIAQGGNVESQYGVPTETEQAKQPIIVEEQRGNTFNTYGPPPKAQLPPLVTPQQQYLPPPQQHTHGTAQQYQHQHFVHTQGLPFAQEARFNQPQDCGHGPNLVESSNSFNQHHQTYPNPPQQHQISFNSIAQSIPVVEQHNQFLSPPSTNYGSPSSSSHVPPPQSSYGPPPHSSYGPPQLSDNVGSASQHSTAVVPLNDGIDPKNLPGLEGLKVISAQKAQSIQLPTENLKSPQTSTYHLRYQAEGPISSLHNHQPANHDEILSQGILQSVFTAIDNPTNSGSEVNRNAQSRSDTNVPEKNDESEEDKQKNNESQSEDSEKSDEKHNEEDHNTENSTESDEDSK